MSIKDLFSNKPTVMQSANSASVDIESPDFLEALRKQRDEVVPPIDFMSASNFVRFGSAKEYYAESIKRIYNYYPYDGSEKEKIEFNLSSSYLDRYIFDYKYPKHTGYAKFSSDSYIQINRGYNKATTPTSTKLSKLFSDNDPYYDSSNRKKQSFVFDLDDGVTIEWWMNKEDFDTKQETFFELKSSNIKLDLVLTGTVEPVKLYASSSAEISLSTISDSGFESTDLANSSWSHYAVSISNTAANTIVNFYRNGVHKKQSSFTRISTPEGNMTGYIASGSYGLLSASVDEFRYWNKKQSSESIYNNYISGINGGANTDSYRKEISVYFKFNEGETGITDTDRIVLDYSGRLSNGYWHDYGTISRQDGSYTSSEVADPIIRSANPRVQGLQTEMETSGSSYDANSKMQLYDLIPSWIRDEDEENGEELKHIIQIVSSYFDTLYAQIEFLPNIKDKHYYQDDEKPLPFIRRILEERGIVVSDILINRSIVEYFQKKDLNGIQYEKDIEILKNRIYHNIYNNLEYIYKTKGTEKSYRNMLRCFGIDDELVKLNLYTDNGKQYLIDKTKHTSQKTKHIDFDEPSNFSATVYLQGNISGSKTQNLEKNNAITLEAELMVPKKVEESSANYYYTSFSKSSVFGLDAIEAATSTYVSTANLNNFQVYLVRDATESKRAKWVVEQTNHDSGASTVIASSNYYEDIYDNQRWNIAVKVYPEGYPFAGSFATTENPNYVLELYGVTHNFDEILHEFSTTATLTYANGTSLLSADKKVYVGARRTNWSGSVLCQSDVKVAACSLYYDKLDDVSIKQHNLDPSNYGHNRVFGNPTPFMNTVESTHLPAQHSLTLHWDFQTVTGSNTSGEFTVEDFSSASVNDRYGWLGNIVVQEHKGTGFGFPASNTALVKNEFVFASKKELPEISYTSDNVTIVGDNEIYLYEDDDVSDNVFAFEKSMYQVVSQEMLNMFSTMIEFSNMFAKPVDRYRFNYKRLSHARKLFFEKTSADLDLDRFTEYYKWIDSSISFFLEQLHPANAKFNKGITETIESHILERPKYQHLLANIEEHKTIKEQPVRGINELTYNWKSGHAPVNDRNENVNCLWRRERENRTGLNSSEREQLRKVISSDTYVEEIPLFGSNDGSTYQGSTYGLRRFSRPHKLSIKEQKTIHGGINYERAKDRDFLKTLIPRHGTKTGTGIPTDVVVLGVGPGQGLIDNQPCEENNTNPNNKEKYGSIAIVGKYSNFDGSSPISGSGVTSVTAEYAYNLKGQRVFPFNLMSGNIATGYNTVISSSYAKDVYLTNLHSDTTDPTNEIPMQGPFTKTWVGGRQARHIALNRGTDGEYTRPEEWRILIGDHPESTDQDGAMGITGPDYGGPYPDPTRESAVHFRDGRVKRPVNIQNIKTTGGVEGNYNEKYEVVSIVGRKENNLKFREFEPTHKFIPTELGNQLPQTTNLLTLATIAPSSSGNVWGIGESNRINAHANLLRKGLIATGSFVVTGATLYKAPYSASLNIQPIPHQGRHHTYYFQAAGATDYDEIYTGSFDVVGIPNAGIHQSYYFVTTGSTHNTIDNIYTGTFDLAVPPIKEQHDIISFRVSASSGLTDGDLLQITASSTDKLFEVNSNNTLDSNTDLVIRKSTNLAFHAYHASHFPTLSSSYLSLSDTDDFSISYWVKEHEISGFDNYFRFKSGAGTDVIQIRHNEDSFRVTAYGPGGNHTHELVGDYLTGSAWVQTTIVFTRDYSQQPAFYFNGGGPHYVASGSIGGLLNPIGAIELRLPDERASHQDFTIWNTALTLTDAQELYNGGNWSDVTSHTKRSSILDWYQMGNEDYLADLLLVSGSNLTGLTTVSSSYGSGSNDLTITSNQQYISLTDGVGTKTFTNDEIWNKLTSSLNTNFPGYTANYITGATDAQFFLRKDTAGSNVASAAELGNSFFDLHFKSGATAVASNLEDGDTISISGSTFNVRQTTSGSSALDLVVGDEYRKAFSWNSTSERVNHLSNTSYSNPDDSTATSVSFWFKPEPGGSVSYVATLGDQNSNSAISVWSSNDDLDFYFGNGSSNDKVDINNLATANKWMHITVTAYKNLSTTPKIWINGEAQDIDSDYSSPGGTLDTIDKIYIGDKGNTSSDNETRGSIQDFVVWNTQLTNTDVEVLYNSGSWFDLHSHISASYIWDWWMLGNEGSYTSGSSLQTNGITEVVPTIGRHTLSIGTNATGTVLVSDGILSSSKDAATWRSHVVSRIEAETLYTAQVSSNTIKLNQTASSAISDSLSNSNNTFTNEAVFGLDRSEIIYVSGAIDTDSIEIQNMKFIVSTASSPSTFASSSAGISINSTGSNFWNHLSGAIEQYLPAYTASYYVHNNQAEFFVRNGYSGSVSGHSAWNESGNTFSGLHRVTGSDKSPNTTLTHGDTLSLDTDTFTLRYTTSGSAATDLVVGRSYRKALRISGSDGESLSNTSYSHPTGASKISFSGWVKGRDRDNGDQSMLVQLNDSSGDAILRLRHSNLNLNGNISRNDGSFDNFSVTNVGLNSGSWAHVAFTYTVDDSSAPKAYINGVEKSVQSYSPSSTATNNLARIYIGANDSNAQEIDTAFSDFAIWSVGLTQKDATILYNSGSWLDLHSHASASYIWDWWMLGNEPGITQASGSSLDAGSAVTSIVPTIGRHSLTVNSNSDVDVTDGIVADKRTDAEFKTHILDVINLQSNFIADRGAYELDITSSVIISSTGSFAETGSTFILGDGIVFTKYGAYHSGSYAKHAGIGSVDPFYGIKLENKTFWISGSTSPTGSYAIDGNNVYVYSHTSSNEAYWNNLTAAIDAVTDLETTYFVSASTAHFFARKPTSGSTGNVVFQIGANCGDMSNHTIEEVVPSHDSFSNNHIAIGSNTSGSSTLADQNTLRITDNMSTGSIITVGHTTNGTGLTINTGHTYRKALRWPATGDNNCYLYNTSYENPTSNNIAITFWANSDNTSAASNYLLHTQAGSNNSLEIFRYGSNLHFKFYSGPDMADDFRHYTSSTIVANKWEQFTVNVDTTNIQTLPVLYKNGQIQTVGPNSTPGPGTGAMLDINKIYIGDSHYDSALYEWQGSIQDFAIWNTSLTSEDATILHNSGSWFDLHSHTSASSIWDWWMLGEDISINTGQDLDAASITVIPTTIGRHILATGAQARDNIIAVSGTMENGKSNTTFWEEITQSILINTEFNQSHNGALSGDVYQLTASTKVTSSMMLKETVLSPTPAGSNVSTFVESGTTFTILSNVFRGPDDLNRQRYVDGGSSHMDYLYIGPNFAESTGSYFIIDNKWNRGSNGRQDSLYSIQPNPEDGWVREGSLTYVGSLYPPVITEQNVSTSYYKIKSSASSNQEFWSNLGDAIKDAYPNYTVISSSEGLQSQCTFTIFGQLEETGYLLDLEHVHNRNMNGGKKKYSISSKKYSTATQAYLYNTSVSGYATDGAFSATFWLKTEETTQTNRYIMDSKDSSNRRSTYIKLGSGYDLYFGVYDDEDDLTEWKWDFKTSKHTNALKYRGLYLAITWDGNFSSDPDLYINGQLSTEIPAVDGTTYSVSITETTSEGAGADRRQIQKLWLLDSGSTGEYNLQGSISDFALWNTKLFKSDVGILYNSGSYFDISTAISASSVVDYWHLGEEGVLTASFNNPSRGLVPGDSIPSGTELSYTLGLGTNGLTASSGLYLSVGFNNYTHDGDQTFTGSTGITGGLDQVLETGLVNVVQKESDNIDGTSRQKTIIASRFSAPGGIEVQTYGYLDAYAHEYSVHNSLNYRNYTVKNNSGEDGTIRINSHNNRREGLRTLLSRPMGRFGVDSQHGAVSVNSYEAEASFHKIHNNSFTKPIINSKAIRIPTTTEGQVGYTASGAIFDYATTGPFSFSFWIKMDSDSLESKYILQTNDPDGNRAVDLNFKNNTLFLVIWESDLTFNRWGWSIPTQFPDVTVTEWNHYAISIESNNASLGYLYINGVRAQDTISENFTGTARRGWNSLSIGDYPIVNSSFELQGSIQEFTTWNTNLSQTNVDELYNNGDYFDVSKVTDISSNIIDHWILGEEQVFEEYDYGATIPGDIVVESVHGFGGNDLTSPSSTSLVTIGFYRTTDITGPTRKDNYFVQSSLPSSDYNYSWVDSSLGNNYSVTSGKQKVFGYWPKKGEISSSAGVDSAIIFPTISDIEGS